MVSSLQRKSITDLSRRRSRTFFAAATLALAVAGIGLFATPALMNRAMSAEVTADRLPDLTISTRPLVLDRAQLATLAAVPNVRAVEPRSFFGGRVYVGARRAFAQVLGIPGFTSQLVNVVHVASGAAPGTGAVLTDVQNARQGLLPVQAGQAVQIIGADGVVRSLQVSGEGRNLDGGQTVTADGVIVLYATPATVASLSGAPGYNQLFFTLADTRPERGQRDDRSHPPYAGHGSGLHRFQRPAAGAGRGRLARQVQLPERLEVLVRDHPARAAVSARADLEHDDHAGLRADI